MVGSWLPSFGGGQIKSVGDALMLRMDSPIGAIELGLAIIGRTADLPDFPEVRVGMNTGPAVERGGDWYGAGVNLAARVAAAARGGEVLLTESTFKSAGRSTGLEIESLGKREFRNIAEPVTVFRAHRRLRGGTHLSVDPVCRMALSPGTAWQTLTFSGLEYLFCSPGCAQKFAADPAGHLRSAGISSPIDSE